MQLSEDAERESPTKVRSFRGSSGNPAPQFISHVQQQAEMRLWLF
jgi:hypothetical protein